MRRRAVLVLPDLDAARPSSCVDCLQGVRSRDVVFSGLLVFRPESVPGLPTPGRLRTAPNAGCKALSQILQTRAWGCASMGGMSLVLSHSTAMMIHRASAAPYDQSSMLPREPQPLKPGPVDMGKIGWARRLLVARGIPESEIESIDVLVLRDCDRRSGKGVIAHTWQYPIPPAGSSKLPGEFMSYLRSCACSRSRPS